MTLPGLDQAAGTITLSLWVADVAAAVIAVTVTVLVVCVALSMRRDGLNVVVGTITGVGLVVIAAATAYTFSNLFVRTAERHALDQRMLELTASSYAAGSNLACLDASLSKALEDACEKAIFGSPEMVAAAGAYVNARLSLLIDGLDFARRSEVRYEASLTELRRAIEADRFGLVAQVFATREGCTPTKCDALAVLQDAARVRSNLKDSTFDEVLARNKLNWPQRERTETPVAAATVRPQAWKFPSAASIPAVSIMTNEPAAPVQAAVAPTAVQPVAPPVRRPPTPSAPRTAQPRSQQSNPAGLAPPVQLGPPVANDGSQPDIKQP
jgi:hypothetical protein